LRLFEPFAALFPPLNSKSAFAAVPFLCFWGDDVSFSLPFLCPYSTFSHGILLLLAQMAALPTPFRVIGRLPYLFPRSLETPPDNFSNILFPLPSVTFFLPIGLASVLSAQGCFVCRNFFFELPSDELSFGLFPCFGAFFREFPLLKSFLAA